MIRGDRKRHNRETGFSFQLCRACGAAWWWNPDIIDEPHISWCHLRCDIPQDCRGGPREPATPPVDDGLDIPASLRRAAS
jgi:hypothetical protein